MSLADAKYEGLASRTGQRTTTSDMEFEWLAALTGQRTTIPDMWKVYLVSLGFTGSVPDAQFAWLGSLGYTGTLADRFEAFWSNNTNNQNFPLTDGRIAMFVPIDADDAAGDEIHSVSARRDNDVRVVTSGWPDEAPVLALTHNAPEHHASGGGWTEYSSPASAVTFAGRVVYGDEYDNNSPFLGRLIDPANTSYIFMITGRHDSADPIHTLLLDTAPDTSPVWRVSSNGSGYQFTIGLEAGVSKTDNHAPAATFADDDIITAALIWNHETAKYSYLGYRYDDSAGVNVEDVLSEGNTLSFNGTYVNSRPLGFSFGLNQTLGMAILEFETFPADWKEGIIWNHDAWRAGDKSMYGLWGTHAKSKGWINPAYLRIGYENISGFPGKWNPSTFYCGNVGALYTGVIIIDNVDVAQGADISVAYLDVTTKAGAGAGTFGNVEVRAVAEGVPGLGVDGNCPSDNTLTTAVTTVSGAAWNAASATAAIIRIDVTDIIKELVALGGFNGSGVYFAFTPVGTYDAFHWLQADAATPGSHVLRIAEVL